MKEEKENTKLCGKNIALCLTGSIAIIGVPNFATQLRKKYGADVRCFMTKNAVKFGLSPRIMEWASKKPVVTELTGSTEHMIDFDLVIVYPATFNTINKIASGIADNAVTALCGATSANKLIIVPAMNIKFYNNSILQDNLVKLRKVGITILGPKTEEGKSNVVSIEEIIDCSVRILSLEKNSRGE